MNRKWANDDDRVGVVWTQIRVKSIKIVHAQIYCKHRMRNRMRNNSLLISRHFENRSGFLSNGDWRLISMNSSNNRITWKSRTSGLKKTFLCWPNKQTMASERGKDGRVLLQGADIKRLARQNRGPNHCLDSSSPKSRSLQPEASVCGRFRFACRSISLSGHFRSNPHAKHRRLPSTSFVFSSEMIKSKAQKR